MLIVILLTCLPFQLSESILEVLVFLVGLIFFIRLSSCASRLLLPDSCFQPTVLASFLAVCLPHFVGVLDPIVLLLDSVPVFLVVGGECCCLLRLEVHPYQVPNSEPPNLGKII